MYKPSCVKASLCKAHPLPSCRTWRKQTQQVVDISSAGRRPHQSTATIGFKSTACAGHVALFLTDKQVSRNSSLSPSLSLFLCASHTEPTRSQQNLKLHVGSCLADIKDVWFSYFFNCDRVLFSLAPATRINFPTHTLASSHLCGCLVTTRNQSGIRYVFGRCGHIAWLLAKQELPSSSKRTNTKSWGPRCHMRCPIVPCRFEKADPRLRILQHGGLALNTLPHMDRYSQ